VSVCPECGKDHASGAGQLYVAAQLADMLASALAVCANALRVNGKHPVSAQAEVMAGLLLAARVTLGSEFYTPTEDGEGAPADPWEVLVDGLRVALKHEQEREENALPEDAVLVVPGPEAPQ